jgi:polyhydroxyalkanoate synthesis regulator phasin
MADIDELERRVAALEPGMKTDIPAFRRDLRRVLSSQDNLVELVEALNRRVAANELIATANARTTEQGFANMQAQINALDAKVEREIGQVKAEITSLRRDLPGMLVDAIRESRGRA